MVRKTVELSETQKGIYFDCQVNDPSSYNISASIQIEGLQLETFRRSITMLMYEQVVLRTHIQIHQDRPVLSIQDDMEYALTLRDLRDVHQDEKHQQMKASIEAFIQSPFVLEQGPLFRMMLIHMDEDEHILTLCIHHLVCDGLSLELLKNKLFYWYNCMLQDL